jgi:hypothetical protein
MSAMHAPPAHTLSLEPPWPEVMHSAADVQAAPIALLGGGPQNPVLTASLQLPLAHASLLEKHSSPSASGAPHTGVAPLWQAPLVQSP